MAKKVKIASIGTMLPLFPSFGGGSGWGLRLGRVLVFLLFLLPVINLSGQTSFSAGVGTTRTYRIDKQPNISSYIWEVFTNSNLTSLAGPADVTITSLGAGHENEIQVTWNRPDTLYLSVTVIDNAGCNNRLAWIFYISDTNIVVAVDDSATITKPVQLIRVLDNDFDPDEGDIDPATLALVSSKGPYHGNININSDGTITYMPDIRYSGPDSFVYIICDNVQPIKACDEAIVRLNVIWDDKLVAYSDHYWLYKDESKIFAVASNDYDPDGQLDFTSVKVIETPKNGTSVVQFDGKILYTPADGFVGRDSFTYEICNKGVPPECDQAWVYINVVENLQLIAQRDDVITSAGGDINIPILENDYDPEGLIDTVSLRISLNPKSGIVNILANGTIDYLPNNGFAGLDSFIYRICDSGFPVTCDTAIVFVNVVDNNVAIVANPDMAQTVANNQVIIPVLTNDFDPDGSIDTLSLAITKQPLNGTVTIQPTGAITYHPKNGYFGIDSLIYRICDNGPIVTCDTAIVYINIVNNNIAIVANPDKVLTNENKQVEIPVLTNDYDPDGLINILSLAITEQPAHGNITIQPNGIISYIPDNGFIGNDEFIYRICDNGPVVSCDTALVTISVVINIPPVALNDTVNGVNGISNIWDVAQNDYDLDDGLDSTSVKIINDANHGTVSVDHTTGLISYVSDNCFFGIDSFTYVVYDTKGNISGTATVYATITINPILDSDGDGALDITEDVNKNGTPCDDDTDKDGIPNYLDTDDDGDGIPSIVEDWNHSGDPADDDTDADGIPNYLDTDDDNDSILTINEDPNHNGNYLDDDTNRNGIINSLDPNDDGDWLMTINEPGDLNSNGVPDYLEVWNSQAQDDNLTIWIGEIINIPVLDNDSTEMNDSTLIIVQNPIHGNARINPKDGSIDYSPDDGYAGLDSFIYEVCDYYNVCDTAIVRINIENLQFPELFSPNGDGANDYYVIGGIENYPNNRFIVFNRWGNKVYEKSGYLNQWDGWANVKLVIGSKELPVGVYYYILRYNDKREKSGALFLER